MRRITAVIALAAFLAPVAAPATDLLQSKHDYEAAKRIVDGGDPDAGYSISNSPEATRALEMEWTDVTAWLGVNRRGSVDSKQLASALKPLDPDYGAIAQKLAPDLYLIGIQRIGFGTFFVVRTTGTGWNVVWTVRQTSANELAHVPLAAAWTAQSARNTCRDKAPPSNWDRCGPISPNEFGILPTDASGHPRFYIDAWYAQSAGETNSFQLSVWTWGGHRAVPQFAKSYQQTIEVEHTPRIVGDVLLVQTKEEFQNFFSCGACVGRQLDWSLKVTPTGIQDLGTKSRMPEVDAIDNLVGRIAHDKPTADLAASAVTKALAPLVASQKDESRKIDPKWFSLAMIGNGETEANPANPNESLVCFSTDADGDRRIFTLQRRGPGFYISKMRDVGEGDRPDRLCTKPND